MKMKKFLSMAMVATMLMSTSVFADTNSVASNDNQVNVQSVNVGDINDAEVFQFSENKVRGLDEPVAKWDFSKGKYSVSGSSNSATLYSNYYFTDVVGKNFNFKAGYGNDITVDLVHRGLIFQTVVSSWTIDAGEVDVAMYCERLVAVVMVGGWWYWTRRGNARF